MNNMSDWIKIEERLPTIKDGHSRATLPIYVMLDGKMTIAEYERCEFRNGRQWVGIDLEPMWICAERGHDNQGEQIHPTHWMEIPTPTLTAENFLGFLKEKYNEEGLDEALFYLCESFYQTLDKENKVEVIDNILEQVNPNDWDDSILVGFLCYTNNYESDLPFIKGLEGRNVVIKNRNNFVKKIREYFEKERPNDVEDLMRGFEEKTI